MPKKKVLILQPSYSHHDRPGFIRRRNRYGLIPSLISPYLAAFFPREHCDVRLHDEILADPDPRHVEDLVVIPFYTSQADRAYALADAYRAHGSPVLMGGYHASQRPEETAEHADCVVVGEFEPVAGRVVADWMEGKLRPRYVSDCFADLNAKPFPRYDLLDWKAYRSPWMRVSVPLETSRGCPHDCDFCSVKLMHGQRMRFRDIPLVLDDIARIRRETPHGDEHCLFFTDENLSLAHPRNIALLEALVPLKVGWSSFFSMENARQPALLDLAHRSGCLGAVIGFENVDKRNIAAVNKPANHVEQYVEAARAFKRAGIQVFGCFISGFPDDDAASLRRTVETLDAMGIPFAFHYPLYPTPGTRLYDRYVAEGRLKDPRYWLRPHSPCDLIFRPHFDGEPGGFPEAFKAMTRDFYSLPRIVKRSLPWGRRAPGTLLTNLGLRYLTGKDGENATL